MLAAQAARDDGAGADDDARHRVADVEKIQDGVRTVMSPSTTKLARTDMSLLTVLIPPVTRAESSAMTPLTFATVIDTDASSSSDALSLTNGDCPRFASVRMQGYRRR